MPRAHFRDAPMPLDGTAPSPNPSSTTPPPVPPKPAPSQADLDRIAQERATSKMLLEARQMANESFYRRHEPKGR